MGGSYFFFVSMCPYSIYLEINREYKELLMQISTEVKKNLSFGIVRIQRKTEKDFVFCSITNKIFNYINRK